MRNVNLPAQLDAQVVYRDLCQAFDEESQSALAQAYLRLSIFYGLDFPPSVILARRVNRANAHWAGFCTERGRIILMHPGRWKRNRRWNTRARWIEVALHEFGHYIFFSHPEDKADWFAMSLLERAGVNAPSHLTSQPKLRRKGHKLHKRES